MSPTHSLSYSDSNNEIKLQIIDYDLLACVATDCGGESLHPVESLHLLDFVQDVPRELGGQQEICPSSGLVVPVLEMTVRQFGQNLLIETVRSDESGQSLDRLVNFEYTLEVPGLTQGRVPV